MNDYDKVGIMTDALTDIMNVGKRHSDEMVAVGFCAARAKTALDSLGEGQETVADLTEQDVKMLYLYRDIAPDIQRIIGLVQDNPTYFGAGKRLGQSCVKIAADKLEALVKEQ